MFRNDLYMHQRDSIRFALFLMTLESRVRAQGGARGQDLGHHFFFFFFKVKVKVKVKVKIYSVLILNRES